MTEIAILYTHKAEFAFLVFSFKEDKVWFTNSETFNRATTNGSNGVYKAYKEEASATIELMREIDFV